VTTRQRVAFRVDESSLVGFGHMSRCRALAEALLKAHAEVTFHCHAIRQVTRQELQGRGVRVIDVTNEQDFLSQDWHDCVVIVDGYQFDTDYWRQLVSTGACRTVFIDDFRGVPYLADLVICNNEGVRSDQFELAPHTRLLLGGRYLLLRPEILLAARSALGTTARQGLLIAAGGTRQERWVADMLSHLSRMEPGRPLWVLSGRRLSTHQVLQRAGLQRSKVRLFSGLDAKAMLRLYRRARCLLTPASTVMLEAFSVGCPVMSGWVADNQRNSLACFDRKGLIANAGDLRQVSLPRLKRAYARAMHQPERMARRQRTYIQNAKSGVDEVVQAILGTAKRNSP
jgi:UDP-2,4-diacetamido-2,4,6-trideoxy-beta-L-altropyranose hydrolase